MVYRTLSDWKSIKPISEANTRAFVKMVERLERCWFDMKRMHWEREMNTASMERFMEKITHLTQRREWIIASEQHKNFGNIFEVLMEFLLKPSIAYKGQDDVCVSRSVHQLVVILLVEEFTENIVRHDINSYFVSCTTLLASRWSLYISHVIFSYRVRWLWLTILNNILHYLFPQCCVCNLCKFRGNEMVK